MNSKPDDATKDENKVNELPSGCDQSTQTENVLVKQSPSNPENMSDDQSCDQITHLWRSTVLIVSGTVPFICYHQSK